MNVRELLLTEDTPIIQALDIIAKGAKSIALIVDTNNKLLGTLNDGDIRRALLNSYDLQQPIKDIYQQNPCVCTINDTKEFIIQKAIKNKVYQIPIVDNNYKLVDLEDLATLLTNVKRKNRVFLMAGGLGTRLRPLTTNTPKPLLEVGNKPILETIIENFAKYGFVNITISVNYKANMIKDYFGDGSRFGVNIDYIEETKRLGTAGALGLIDNKPTEPFFVMNADLLTNINFTHLLDFHSFENSIATMCVREYDFQVPFGVVETEDGNIVSIKEKPVHKFFVNAGIYTLSPQVFQYIPINTFYDMPTLFEDLIQNQHKTISFPIHEYWLDIGRIEEFEKANNEYDEVF